ncbi:hypothetical protein M2284_002653 [Rhodococcus sp. LBL1]|nr:hypothetical protein [Rhodococcus sp. LBL1]MDH6684037.1 hypothetical protein [Rhodococcus sp. LBL2]
MTFTPIVMRSPDGRECRVGSALEREQLINRGYEVVAAKSETSKPAEAPKTPAESSKTTTQATK